MAGNHSITTWIGKLRAGDEEAAKQLWDRYFHRLVELARGKLQGASRRATDEEDVALSAFHSFYQAAAQARFDRLDDRNDLWQILVMLTARKAVTERRRQNALKRGGQETPEGRQRPPGPVLADADLDAFVGTEPDPAFAAMFVEEYANWFRLLPDEGLRQVARLRLEGYTNGEIARQLGTSERSIERKLSLIRGFWQEKGQET